MQGEPANLDQLTGRVVLLEVFQVNCPGCFLYALPQAIDLHYAYYQSGLSVIGIATAFEDFDKNTLTNLSRLADKSEVIGETYRALEQEGMLTNGILPYKIPFPLAMDSLVKNEAQAREAEIRRFIEEQIPDFEKQPLLYRENIIERVRTYFEKREYRAETFELYNLKGTPSYILIDKQGVLRKCEFGDHSVLESQIQALLIE